MTPRAEKVREEAGPSRQRAASCSRAAVFCGLVRLSDRASLRLTDQPVPGSLKLLRETTFFHRPMFLGLEIAAVSLPKVAVSPKPVQRSDGRDWEQVLLAAPVTGATLGPSC